MIGNYGLDGTMVTTTHVIFACDESGAKGSAKRQETYSGEIGVFAGILVPQEIDADARSEFQTIYDQYKPPSGKLHIAILPPDRQESLRQDVYAAIQKLKLPCFWYALHVEGLNNWHLIEKERLEDSKRSMLKVRPEPRIKLNNPRINVPSMHEQLFEGLYERLIAFLEERKQKLVSIEVRMDQVDSPIVKNFEAVAKRLLSDDRHLRPVKGWDTKTTQPVHGSIQSDVIYPSTISIEATVSRLIINPIRDEDGYVLAADVLANSLNHLFRCREQSELYNALNEPTAIEDHPIATHFDTFYDWGNGDLIGDRLYRHPKAKGR